MNRVAIGTIGLAMLLIGCRQEPQIAPEIDYGLADASDPSWNWPLSKDGIVMTRLPPSHPLAGLGRCIRQDAPATVQSANAPQSPAGDANVTVADDTDSNVTDSNVTDSNVTGADVTRRRDSPPWLKSYCRWMGSTLDRPLVRQSRRVPLGSLDVGPVEQLSFVGTDRLLVRTPTELIGFKVPEVATQSARAIWRRPIKHEPHEVFLAITNRAPGVVLIDGDLTIRMDAAGVADAETLQTPFRWVGVASNTGSDLVAGWDADGRVFVLRGDDTRWRPTGWRIDPSAAATVQNPLSISSNGNMLASLVDGRPSVAIWTDAIAGKDGTSGYRWIQIETSAPWKSDVRWLGTVPGGLDRSSRFKSDGVTWVTDAGPWPTTVNLASLDAIPRSSDRQSSSPNPPQLPPMLMWSPKQPMHWIPYGVASLNDSTLWGLKPDRSGDQHWTLWDSQWVAGEPVRHLTIGPHVQTNASESKSRPPMFALSPSGAPDEALDEALDEAPYEVAAIESVIATVQSAEGRVRVDRWIRPRGSTASAASAFWKKHLADVDRDGIDRILDDADASDGYALHQGVISPLARTWFEVRAVSGHLLDRRNRLARQLRLNRDKLIVGEYEAVMRRLNELWPNQKQLNRWSGSENGIAAAVLTERMRLESRRSDPVSVTLGKSPHIPDASVAQMVELIRRIDQPLAPETHRCLSWVRHHQRLLVFHQCDAKMIDLAPNAYDRSNRRRSRSTVLAPVMNRSIVCDLFRDHPRDTRLLSSVAQLRCGFMPWQYAGPVIATVSSAVQDRDGQLIAETSARLFARYHQNADFFHATGLNRGRVLEGAEAYAESVRPIDINVAAPLAWFADSSQDAELLETIVRAIVADHPTPDHPLLRRHPEWFEASAEISNRDVGAGSF